MLRIKKAVIAILSCIALYSTSEELNIVRLAVELRIEKCPNSLSLRDSLLYATDCGRWRMCGVRGGGFRGKET